MAVEEAQPRLTLLREERVDQRRDCLLHAKRRLGTAQLRADPARRHQHQCAPVISMARGITAHILVERGLAASIDLMAAPEVVGDAALARGHDADQAVDTHQLLQSLHRAHDAERVGEHHAHELLVRCLGDRLGLIVVGRAGVDEQHVEGAAREPLAQVRDLVGHGDVEVFDRHLIGVSFGEIVERGPAASANGANDAPIFLHELRRHRVAEAA